MIEVIECLLGKEYDIRIYDKNVSPAKLMSANKDFILNHIPHISKLMVNSPAEIVAHRDIIIFGTNNREFENIFSLTRKEQMIVDFARITQHADSEGSYDGIY